MEKKYCVYMHKNKQNGKIYIGQTCQKPEYRWNHGKGYKECPYFYAAIQKYGWDNFEHIILLTGLSLEEANFQEEKLIKLYHSNEEEFGYNIQSGGLNRQINDIGKQKCSENAKNLWTDEHKNYMSNLMKEKWQDPEYREKQRIARENNKHTISEKGKKNISEARKEYIAKYGTPTQNKGHSEETKEKIRAANIVEKNPQYGHTTSDKQKQITKEIMSKKVKCIETGQIFNSRQEASEWCGLASGTGISACINGKKKSAGKHPITKEPLHWENA